MAAQSKKDRRRKRHLFYVCYEDLTQEGAWTVHIREVVNNWEKLGVKVTLFAPGIWPFTVWPICDVVYVPTIHVRIVREYLYLMIVPLYIFFLGLKRRPDAVYCREMSFMTPIMCAVRLLGVPIVMEINGFILRDLKLIGISRAKRAVFRFLQWMNVRLADGLVFVSEDFRTLFSKQYRIDDKRTSVVPNGVDTDLFSPGDRNEAIGQLGLDPARRYIVFVGTFYPHSLAPVIIRAARQIVTDHPDIDFIMIGRGQDLGSCRKTVERLGISSRIIFTGTVQNRRIPQYLRAASILIDLYRFGGEGKSMKLLEYLSSGGAVVCNYSVAYGVPLHHRKDVFFINEATPEELARAIEVLVSDEVLRIEIGKNARDLIVDNFSWGKTAAKLLHVVDEVRNDR